MSIFVVLESTAGVSAEALQAGSALGPLSAVVVGQDAGDQASKVRGQNLQSVIAIAEPHVYTADGYTAALQQLIEARKPRVVIFPHTYQVRDYAPKLAARFGQPLVSDVVEIKKDGDTIVCTRQLFQGKLNADVRCSGEPIFISLQAGAFRASDDGTGAPVETFEARPDVVRTKPEPPYRESQRTVDLSAAERIVAVGRGIKEKNNLSVVEELAEAVGAELAASRPICDNEWLPMERQVGSSGQTVAPKLYIAVGISGAIQHLVGMKGSKTVVAINKDETAPIFEMADYGIVGDLFDVVPALVHEIKKAKT